MKKCRILNDKLSWLLIVDDRTIPFNGAGNAGYFSNLYSEMGYEVEFDYEYYKQEDETDT